MSFNKDLSGSHFYGLCCFRPHLLRKFRLFQSYNFGPREGQGLGRERRVSWGGISIHAPFFVSRSLQALVKCHNLSRPGEQLGAKGSENFPVRNISQPEARA